MHLDVINSLTNALKLERMRLQEQHERIDGYPSLVSRKKSSIGDFADDEAEAQDGLLKDIVAMLELPVWDFINKVDDY